MYPKLTTLTVNIIGADKMYNVFLPEYAIAQWYGYNYVWFTYTEYICCDAQFSSTACFFLQLAIVLNKNY